MKHIKYLFLLIIFVLLMIFAVSNDEGIYINFGRNNPIPLLGYSADTTHTSAIQHPDEVNISMPREPRKVPIYLVIFGTFAFGFLVSWILGLREFRRLRKANRGILKEKNQLMQELEQLRLQPLVKEPVSTEPASGESQKG